MLCLQRRCAIHGCYCKLSRARTIRVSSKSHRCIKEMWDMQRLYCGADCGSMERRRALLSSWDLLDNAHIALAFSSSISSISVDSYRDMKWCGARKVVSRQKVTASRCCAGDMVPFSDGMVRASTRLEQLKATTADCERDTVAGLSFLMEETSARG
jgi:hypothetical protein